MFLFWKPAGIYSVKTTTFQMHLMQSTRGVRAEKNSFRPSYLDKREILFPPGTLDFTQPKKICHRSYGVKFLAALDAGDRK